jgi:hypothetical protein
MTITSPSRATSFFLLTLLLLCIGPLIAFHSQAFFFDREVRSVLARLEQFQLEKTSEDTVLKALPQLEPDAPFALYAPKPAQYKCPADACYMLHLGNVPNGGLVKLKYRLGPRFDWIFRLIYRLGHRFLAFDSWVQIRGGTIANFGYSILVESANRPGDELVSIAVSGTNRASFSRGSGFNLTYDEINRFRVRVASNAPTTSLFVAFTPEARAEDIRKAFAANLKCAWNFDGCSAASQILPEISE